MRFFSDIDRSYKHGQATNYETPEGHFPAAARTEKYKENEIRPSRQEEMKRFREILMIWS